MKEKLPMPEGLKNLKTSMTIYKEKDYVVLDSEETKILKSDNANYIFNKENGCMKTWGKTLKEDVEAFPAPTILDLEVTTICNGTGGIFDSKDYGQEKICDFCYKGNNPKGKNMSFETFKKVFDKLPHSLTQVAFGADSKCQTNPDLWKMMKYANNCGIIPNITASQVDKETAKEIAKYCGAAAISRYHEPDIFAESVKNLTDLGMEQINCHMMISEETFDRSMELIDQVVSDPRLEKLNAIVFLALKTKGRGVGFHPLSQIKFNLLVERCKTNNINYGFDSCGSLKFFNSLSEGEYKEMGQYIQPCESTLESSYINVDGDFFPCSFTEGTEGWETGLSVLNCENFVDNIWNNPRTVEFRNKLIETKKNNKFGCRNCPIYTI